MKDLFYFISGIGVTVACELLRLGALVQLHHTRKNVARTSQYASLLGCTEYKLLVTYYLSGCSSAGRAHALGARGHRFKSCHPDF